jgi:stage V sporulation protein R
MAGVVVPGTYQFNPYHLGWAIWKDIHRRWEHPETDERERWGRPGGQGDQKIFEVRETDNDASFIANYLSDDLIADLKLFRYRWVRDRGDEAVYKVLDVPDAEGYERIRLATALQVGHNLFPMLRVVDASYYQDRTLVLEHVHDGRDLRIFEPELPLGEVRAKLGDEGELTGEVRLAEVGHVLKHIGTIWKNRVVLQTRYNGAPMEIRCDRDGQFRVEVGGRSGHVA